MLVIYDINHVWEKKIIIVIYKSMNLQIQFCIWHHVLPGSYIAKSNHVLSFFLFPWQPVLCNLRYSCYCCNIGAWIVSDGCLGDMNSGFILIYMKLQKSWKIQVLKSMFKSYVFINLNWHSQWTDAFSEFWKHDAKIKCDRVLTLS